MPILTVAEMYLLLAQHGVTGELARVMTSGAMAESGLNTHAVGDQGHAIGLFQLHDQGAGAGLGDSRYDPDVQVRTMLAPYRDWFTYWTDYGQTGAQRAAFTAAYAERPWDYQNPNSAAQQGYRRAYEQVGPPPSEQAPPAPAEDLVALLQAEREWGGALLQEIGQWAETLAAAWASGDATGFQAVVDTMRRHSHGE